jgi:hypothetical protein
MEKYGHYGIAFPKQWGIEKGIQPVQYINDVSNLCIDMAEAMGVALRKKAKSSDSEIVFKNFILHQLLYYKPYQGKMKKGNKKCFEDEREWRYIPNLTSIEMPQVILDKLENIEDYNNALTLHSEIALGFDYKDIKHIIIPNMSDFDFLLRYIDNWNIETSERNILLSKLIVWDEIGGDL